MVFRGGSRAAANDFQPLTIIIKHSILDVAAALDPPLKFIYIGFVSFILCK